MQSGLGKFEASQNINNVIKLENSREIKNIIGTLSTVSFLLVIIGLIIGIIYLLKSKQKKKKKIIIGSLIIVLPIIIYIALIIINVSVQINYSI